MWGKLKGPFFPKHTLQISLWLLLIMWTELLNDCTEEICQTKGQLHLQSTGQEETTKTLPASVITVVCADWVANKGLKEARGEVTWYPLLQHMLGIYIVLQENTIIPRS